MATVLVVDDQPLPRRHLREELLEAGLAVVEARDGEDAWNALARQPADLVVTDLHMPRCDGIELLERIREHSDVPVIVLTGAGTVEAASRAFKAGADEFIHAPDLDPSDLVRMICDTADSARPAGPSAELARRIVGQSAAAGQLRWRIAGMAPLGTPVLVSGAAGVGKATVVRALHELGASASLPLTTVAADEFALPRVAGESGPDGGPFHLHGIEALSAEAQRYWAARLQQAKGSAYRGIPRVFFSTRDFAGFQRRVDDGDFHAGLASALTRFHLPVPSLADRAEDVPEIAQRLSRRIGAAIGRPGVRLSGAALAYLAACPWPGNARQLERLLEQAITFAGDRVIRRRVVRQLLEEQAVSVEDLRAQRRSREHAELVAALADTGGNITRVAERLGKSRPTVYRMIERFKIPLGRERRTTL